MKKLALAVTIATAAAGCATIQKVSIDSNSVSVMKGQTVALTTRAAKPDFAAQTAGKAAFAVLGAVAMISAGNEIIRTNDVQDPAGDISRWLGDDLRDIRGMQVVAPITVTSGDAEQLASAASGKARYVLDVETVNWMFGYFPTDWSHYRVMHVANARLVDVATRKVVAQGQCKHMAESNTDAPTYDELLDNRAAALKKELSVAALECASTLKKEMLAL